MTRPFHILAIPLLSSACLGTTGTPLTTWPSPDVRAGALAVEAPTMGQLYEEAHPGSRVLRVEPLQTEWTIARNELTGQPVRHIAQAQLGIARGDKCYVLVANFSQEADLSGYGPIQWHSDDNNLCAAKKVCGATIEYIKRPQDYYSYAAAPVPCTALADAPQAAGN